MRRTIIILPGTLRGEAFRQKLPTLQAMVELGRVFKLTPTPEIETPEALWLGMGPNEGQLRQGPLTVSALGADPPERSTHFHVTPMSLDGNSVAELAYDIPLHDQRMILEQAHRLNTKTLTFLGGENKDHGLVWEGLGDLRTRPPACAARDGLNASLPQGDAEPMLRRFIDDSMNLLSELEFNHQRVDEGLPPVNLLWPWGHGVRSRVPNLALRRGEPAMVMSGSLRLMGLSRLAGYRHFERNSFGRGMNVRLDDLAAQALREPVSVIVIESPGELAARQQIDELHWLVREIEKRLMRPLFEGALKSSARITVLAPAVPEGMQEPAPPNFGLGLTFQTGNQGGNSIPFDERALDEKLPSFTVWEAIEQAVEPPAVRTTPA